VPAKWVGAVIGVYVENVTFGGKRVAGLRLRVLAAAPTKSGPSSTDEPGHVDMDDDIPL